MPDTGMAELSDFAVHSDRIVGKAPIVLPQRCVTCNGDTGGQGKRFRTDLAWVRRWVYLLLPVNVLLFGLVYLVVRKKVRVEFSICAECSRRRSAWGVACILSWLVFAVSLYAAIVTGSMASFVLLFVSLVHAGFTGLMASLPLRARKLDATHFAIRGFGQGFLGSFERP